MWNLEYSNWNVIAISNINCCTLTKTGERIEKTLFEYFSSKPMEWWHVVLAVRLHMRHNQLSIGDQYRLRFEQNYSEFFSFGSCGELKTISIDNFFIVQPSYSFVLGKFIVGSLVFKCSLKPLTLPKRLVSQRAGDRLANVWLVGR